MRFSRCTARANGHRSSPMTASSSHFFVAATTACAEASIAFKVADSMALKATIFKVELQIADMDRNYYRDHALTIARHPSETDERMMMRLLAYALHADEALAFGKGLSADDEPDL